MAIDTIYNSMVQTYCNLKQIVANGFAVPSAPTGLAAIAGDTTVDLTWTSGGPPSHNVYRGTADGGPYSLIATGIVTSAYHDTGLSNGTTYYYVVTAVDGGGESANSNQASATPLTTMESQFDGSTLTAGAIVSWPDSSGNGHNLSGTATVIAALQNGLNGVVFNGTSNVMSGTLTTPSARTVAVVLMGGVTSTTNYAINIGATSNGLRRTAAVWQFFSPATSFTGTNALAPAQKVMLFVLHGATVDIYVSGALIVAGQVTTDANGLAAAVFLGAATAISGFKAITILEINTWASALSAGEIAVQSSNLKTKWALP